MPVRSFASVVVGDAGDSADTLKTRLECILQEHDFVRGEEKVAGRMPWAQILKGSLLVLLLWFCVGPSKV